MSLGNDFLNLINALWDIEQFDMWNPKEHSSLAYLLDRTYGTAEYPSNYARWMALAQNKEFNEFAWSVSKASVEACREDRRISAQEIETLEKFLEWEKADYEKGRLSGFGLIDEAYIPDWFWELFGGYIKQEKLKRELSVKTYLMKEAGMSNQQTQETYDKLDKHYDLLNELYFYVRNRRFVTFYPTTAQGITAKQLHETYNMSPVGAYNYLIYLRESPGEALADLKKGLPRR